MMTDSHATPTNIPIPDPSIITVQEIDKTRTELRAEFLSALSAQRELMITAGTGRHEKALLRIKAVERAQQSFEDNMNRVPTLLDREAGRLSNLFEEKLNVIRGQISSVNEYATAQRNNNSEAVKAAFVSAEKIAYNQRMAFEQQITKSETSFTKELDALKALLSANRDAVNAAIFNLTGRLDRGEGGLQGTQTHIVDQREKTQLTVMTVSSITGFLVLMVMIIGMWISIHNSSSVSASNPTIGADTKRVDDLISLTTESNREMSARLDALSNRLNTLTGPKSLPP